MIHEAFDNDTRLFEGLRDEIYITGIRDIENIARKSCEFKFPGSFSQKPVKQKTLLAFVAGCCANLLKKRQMHQLDDKQFLNIR